MEKMTSAPRAAGLGDVQEVLRLAAGMYAAMGDDPQTPGWRRAAHEAFTQGLGDDVVVLVFDDPDRPGALAACGAAVTSRRLPGPGNVGGSIGYLQWISTDERWRRRGLARALVIGLLDELRRRRVGRVELHASPEGLGLYRSLGFVEDDSPALRLSMR